MHVTPSVAHCQGIKPDPLSTLIPPLLPRHDDGSLGEGVRQPPVRGTSQGQKCRRKVNVVCFVRERRFNDIRELLRTALPKPTNLRTRPPPMMAEDEGNQGTSPPPTCFNQFLDRRGVDSLLVVMYAKI